MTNFWWSLDLSTLQKSLVRDVTLSSNSLMNNRKTSVPSSVLCGTPLMTDVSVKLFVYNYFCVRLDKSTWSRLCLGTDSIVENVFTIVFHEELDQRLSRNPRLPDHLFVHLCRLSVLTCRLVLLAFDSSSLVWICKRVDRSDLQSSATSLSGRVVWKMIVD